MDGPYADRHTRSFRSALRSVGKYLTDSVSPMPHNVLSQRNELMRH
jgi:hypothetical protein